MIRSFDEINEKIRSGKVTVVTAEEVVGMVKEQGVKAAFEKVDVVTTATFGAMCSSGAFLNFGHADPPIRMGKIWLNDVPASGGLAAVDTYIGATEPSDKKGIAYGGAHVSEDLIAGRKVRLHAESGTTDCYPRASVDTVLTINDLNQAYMYNPRNCYQNYNIATNSSDRTIHTYMGTLLPNYANMTYSTAGELSPLLKDPKLRTIGIGTKIFFGGSTGYVAWQGTQCVQDHTHYEDGEDYNGATLALVGDMKQMSPRYVRGATMQGYGVTIYLGVGIPIPVLDEDLMYDLSRPNEELWTNLKDYSLGRRARPNLARYNYAQLRSGSVEFNGRKVKTSPMSSLAMAREIAGLLKDNIAAGEFTLQQPIAQFPKTEFKPMAMREE